MKRNGYEVIGHNNDDLLRDNIIQKPLAKHIDGENATVLASQTPRLNIPDPVVIHANGSPMHYVTNRFPLFDKKNRISGVFGLTVDVTNTVLMQKSGLFGYLIMAAHNNRRENYLNALFTKKRTACSLPLISPKEAKCLYYILKGKSAREIGEILHISTRTVEGHLAHAKEKLHCKTRSELIDVILTDIQLLYAVQSQLI